MALPRFSVFSTSRTNARYGSPATYELSTAAGRVLSEGGADWREAYMLLFRAVLRLEVGPTRRSSAGDRV